VPAAYAPTAGVAVGHSAAAAPASESQYFGRKIWAYLVPMLG
jgi:hypothetical protein